MYLIYFFLFVLGTIIGSFLNVVILRMNTGFGIGGRSQCFTCGNALSWYELLPVVSYFFLRGKCRSCRSRISSQYPLVEIMTGVLFVLFFQKEVSLLGWGVGLIASLILNYSIWSILVVVLVYDLRHQIIPNAYVFAFISLSVVRAIFMENLDMGEHSLMYSLFAGLMLFLFFFLLWFFSGGKWIGFGDAKLAIGMGIYLGVAQGLSALAFAFWIGAVVAIGILGVQKARVYLQKGNLSSNPKTLTMKSAIPFAPFLILGMLFAFMASSDIFGIHIMFPNVF